MIETWTLVLIVISSENVAPQGLHSIPGFSSELACSVAAEKITPFINVGTEKWEGTKVQTVPVCVSNI